MTDKTAIDCAEALISFCDDRDCVCDGCVFRKNKHDGSGEWGCNIGEIVFRDVYDANEVWENYKSAIRHRGAKMDTDEEIRSRGVWLDIGGVYKCTVCGIRYTGEELEGLGGITWFNFCPNCGAKIEKEEDQ